MTSPFPNTRPEQAWVERSGAVLKRAQKAPAVVAVQPAAPATVAINDAPATTLVHMQTTADPIAVEIAVEGGGGTDDNCTFSMLLL